VTAFEEVYAADGPRLVVEIYAITGSLGEAEDVVQEAFIRAYTRWSRIGAMDAPAAWVRRVALNLATSRWRSRRRALALAHRVRPTEASTVSAPLTEETADLIQALSGLPQRQRTAIVLHYFADLSVIEVADLMRVPESTVKSHLRRGRASLAAALAIDATDESQDQQGVIPR